MTAPYSNPDVDHRVNVSAHSAPKEFFTLSLALLVGVVVVSVSLLLAARWIAPLMPFSWEQWLTGPFVPRPKESAADRARDQALQTLADGLSPHMNLPPGMHVTVHGSASKVPNAFATLGGHIVINQGLLDLMDSENALAMVVAHEIAHVAHRDPIASVGGAALLSVFLSTVLGAGAQSVLSESGSLLTQLSFSRAQESAADTAALDALQKRYGHTVGADRFFATMAEKERDAANTAGVSRSVRKWASSHPDVMERLAAIRLYTAAHKPPQAPLTPLPAALKPTP